MRYLCHELVISVSPTAGIPPPLWQGGARRRFEEVRKRRGVLSQKKPWLFTSLWHDGGCFHGDRSKDSWGCVRGTVHRVVLIARRELHNEWATQEAALHYLSLNQGKEPSVLMHQLRARHVV